MMRVLGDRVLVALPPTEETQDQATGYTVQDLAQTASGLFVAKPADLYNVERATRGIVVQVGEKREHAAIDRFRDLVDDLAFEAVCVGGYDVDSPNPRRICDAVELSANLALLTPAPFDVQVGDCVLFQTSVGSEVSADGVTYVILRESDILAVVEPREKAEAA